MVTNIRDAFKEALKPFGKKGEDPPHCQRKEVQITNIRDAAKAVLNLLGPNGENWTQGNYKELKDGEVCYCIDGALKVACANQKISYHTGRKLGEKISKLVRPGGYEALPIGYGNLGAIHLWNDAPQRTFEDVRKLLNSIAYGKKYTGPTL
jgi:hypothetical protein